MPFRRPFRKWWSVPHFPFRYTARPFGVVAGTGPNRIRMDLQTTKNEMAALRERFNALRGYL